MAYHLQACRKYNMGMMVQIGGCGIADVFELAKHAEQIAVDYVLCLPDIYFKPKTEADLVVYFEHVAKYCPTRPLYYYHIPRRSGVDCKSADSIACRFLPLFGQNLLHFFHGFSFILNQNHPQPQ